MIKKIIFGLAALIAAIAIAAGIYTWDPLPKNPSASDLSAAASNYDVEIIRDTWGTPHIYGKTNADTAFEKVDHDCKMLVVQRTGGDIPMVDGRDQWLHEMSAQVADDCPAEPMEAFGIMLDTAQVLAENLGAELFDEEHCRLRQQTLEHLRARVEEFERRQLLQ